MRRASRYAAAEVGQDEIGVLCAELLAAKQYAVPRPRKVIEGIDGNGKAGTNGVEVNVTDELEQVGTFLDQGVLESVLEEMTDATMAAVEGARVQTEPALHETGERDPAGAEQSVGMVWHQSPSVEGGTGLADELGEAVEKERAVAVGAEDPATLDPSHDDVVQSARIVETGPRGMPITVESL